MGERPVERYRDPWLLVVDKPFGLPTQGTRKGETGLFELLSAREPYLGLHHRLDQTTSGLVLFTLDPTVNAEITRGLRDHTIDRRYEAALMGTPATPRWEMPVSGRPARTDLEILGASGGMSLVALRLHTGRTHQIRQHAAMAGTPVLGDRRYGGEAGRAWPRLALHATTLSLRHPITGGAMVVHSPIPADLQRLWDEILGR